MNLEEIRKNKPLTEWWALVMAHPNFQHIWKMMNDRHPLRLLEYGVPATLDSSSKRLGTIEGYETAMRRLELCAVYEPGPYPLPEATFSPLTVEEQSTDNSNASPS